MKRFCTATPAFQLCVLLATVGCTPDLPTATRPSSRNPSAIQLAAPNGPYAYGTFFGSQGLGEEPCLRLLGGPVERPPSLDASDRCTIDGVQFVAHIFADVSSRTLGASSSGVISSVAGTDFAPFTGKGFVGWPGVHYTVTVNPMIPNISASSVAILAQLDGSMRTSFGTWTGPSSVGVTHADIVALQFNFSNGIAFGLVSLRYDGYTNSNGAELTNPSSFSAFLNPQTGGVDLRGGLVRSQIVPFGDGIVDVDMGLVVYSRWLNQQRVSLHYVGASDNADFSHTATLKSVEVFDAAGHDVSQFYTASTNDGRSLNTGPVLTPTEAIQSLALSVNDELAVQLREGLIAKLDAARMALARDNVTVACNALNAFIHLLDAQTGKAFSADLAIVWRGRVDQITSDLACAS